MVPLIIVTITLKLNPIWYNYSGPGLPNRQIINFSPVYV